MPRGPVWTRTARPGRLAPLFGLCVASMSLAVGCGGAPPASGDGVGPAVGTVRSADGRAALVVPAGALSASTPLTAAPAAGAPTGALVGSAYEFGPDGTVFGVPARLTIAYDPATLPAGTVEGDLVVAKAVGGAWQALSNSTVDTLGNSASAPLSSLSTYGVIVSPGAAPVEVSAVVYVVDSPAAGSTMEFGTLGEAVAALCPRVESGTYGKVVLRTDADVAVGAISLACDVLFETDPDHGGRLVGPGSISTTSARPLRFASTGGVGLSGLTVSAPGGIIVDAVGGLTVADAAFEGDATFNLGGSSATSTAARDGALGGQFDLYRNDFSGLVSVALVADLGATASATFSANGGTSWELGGQGALLGKLTFADSEASRFGVDLTMKAGGELTISQNRQLQQLDLALDMQGEPKVALEGNVAGTLSAQLLGDTVTAHLSMTNNEITDANIGLDVDKAVALISGGTFSFLNVDALKDADVSLTAKDGLKITDELSISSPSSSAQITLGLASLTTKSLRLECQGSVTAELSPGVVLTGGASIGLGTKFSSITAVGLDARGSVGIDFGAGSAGAVVSISDSEFAVGAGLTLRWEDAGGEGVTARQDTPSVALENLVFGETEGPSVLAVGLQCDVTVRDSQLQGTPFGIQATDIGGTLLVADSAFTGDGGIYAFDVEGGTTVTGCEFSLGGDGAGVVCDGTSWRRADVSGCAITGAAPLVAGGRGVVHAESCAIAGGECSVGGRLGLTANEFTPATTIDDEGGGLLEDPIPANDGLLPDNVRTCVDFDGNGCADYPPSRNQKDSEGQCGQEGVPPPGDPTGG